jgi:hypothetical protein
LSPPERVIALGSSFRRTAVVRKLRGKASVVVVERPDETILSHPRNYLETIAR